MTKFKAEILRQVAGGDIRRISFRKIGYALVRTDDENLVHIEVRSEFKLKGWEDKIINYALSLYPQLYTVSGVDEDLLKRHSIPDIEGLEREEAIALCKAKEEKAQKLALFKKYPTITAFLVFLQGVHLFGERRTSLRKVIKNTKEDLEMGFWPFWSMKKAW
jgi:hypothetical protein